MELVGRISGHPLGSLNPVCDDITIARKPRNAASGAANRLGEYTPTANPAALNAATATAPTPTHHHGTSPWSPRLAYTPNITPTKTR